MRDHTDAFALCFADRGEAGRVLAAKLSRLAGRDDAVVIGISHGGVVVAAEIADNLDLPLWQADFERLHTAIPVRGKLVIVVDDGIVTGAGIRAAIAALRERKAAQIVVAVPVAAALTCDLLKYAVEQVVTLAEPDAVGDLDEWYEEFTPVTDTALDRLLRGERRSLALA